VALEIIWLPEAQETFNNTVSFISDEWGDAAETKFIQKAFNLIELIAEDNVSFSWSKDAECFRVPVTKQCSLFYNIIDDSRLELMAFWDTRQDPTKFSL
jgi:plasmid stabilization system protein ParE